MLFQKLRFQVVLLKLMYIAIISSQDIKDSVSTIKIRWYNMSTWQDLE